MIEFVKKYPVLSICIITSFVLMPFLGSVRLFDWDEINFAEASREMLITGNYLQVQIDFKPFWEKPPLFMWMQALSMKVFGVSEYAARFPNAICGLITLPLLYSIGSSFKDKQFGLLWLLTFIGSFLPHFYFQSGIIDPWFNLFIFLGIILPFLPFFKKKQTLAYIIGGISIGCAILTKGPVALLIYILVYLFYIVFQIFRYKHSMTLLIHPLLTIAISILVASLWFGIELYQHGTWFLQEFFLYQVRLFRTGDAGHSGPIYYHIIILLIGCFPASMFAFRKIVESRVSSQIELLMKVLFWVVLILFSIVSTKIIHYSSLCYFPLTYLAAEYISSSLKTSNNFSIIKVFLVIGIVFWTILLAAVPILGIYKHSIIHLIKDPFVKANLDAQVQWFGYELLIPLFFLICGFVSYVLIHRGHMLKGIYIVFLSTIPTLWFFLPIIAPKIEAYTQGSAIEFYQSLQGKDIYAYPFHFKSYAHLFYSKKLPSTNYSLNQQYKSIDEQTLFNGAIDKDVYIVTKLKHQKEMEQNLFFTKLYQKNGFVFYKRIHQIP
jgi:4-amino-4-deoxy-L-arabinose transferase-like glycosyltransferase